MKTEKFKSIVAVCSAIFLAVTLTSCGVSKSDYKALEKRVSALEEMHNQNTESQNTSSAKSRQNTNSENADFDEKTVNDDIDIEQYDYIDDNDKKYSIFVFENNSDFCVDVNLEVTAKDEEDNILHKEEKSITGLPNDGKAYLAFELDDDTDTLMRTVRYSENTSDDNLLKNVTAKAIKAEGGANITLRNYAKTDTDTSNLKFMALYFEDGELVGFDSQDISDYLSSSSSMTVIPSEFYGLYDDVEVYLTYE